jgi:hypothetical protein
MATYTKFQQFVEYMAEGVVNLGSDQLTIALCATASAPVVGNSLLANLTEIAYTNLSARNVTTSTSAQTSGTYKLVLADLVLTASGTVAAFQYVVLYDNTPTSPADPLMGFYDYGSALTLSNGETFTIDFDGTNGVLQLV